MSLSGNTEWIVRDTVLAARELARLKHAYAEATGFEVQIVSRPPGVTSGGQIDVETGQIYVWDDNPVAFREGYIAEELHHYFQLVKQGLIGEGVTLTSEQKREFEADVVLRVQESGFSPYNYRNYEPYTRFPRPRGVAGNDQ